MVVVALEHKDGGRILMVGLSKGNLDGLREGEAMVARVKDHGPSLGAVGLAELVLLPCETEVDFLALLAAHDPHTPSQIHPDLFS